MGRQRYLEAIPRKPGERWIALHIPAFAAADERPGGIVEAGFGPGEGRIIAGVESHRTVQRQDLTALSSQIEALRGERATEGRGGQDENRAKRQAGKHYRHLVT